MTIIMSPPDRQVQQKAVGLRTWLEKAEIARQFSELVADSAFCPMSYKLAQGQRLPRETIVANCTSAILLGDSLGVDPLTSLQNIYVINGKPGLYTNFKIALLMAHDFEFHTVLRKPEICTIRGWKKGPVSREDESPNYTEVTITIDMAEKAEWTKNPQYKKIPADMLYARAAGRLCDMLGADTLHGLATAEDLEDYDDEPVGRIMNSSLTPDSGRASVEAMASAMTGNTTTGGAKIRELVDRQSGENTPAPPVTPTDRVRSGLAENMTRRAEERPTQRETASAEDVVLPANPRNVQKYVATKVHDPEAKDLEWMPTQQENLEALVQKVAADRGGGGIYDGDKIGRVDWTGDDVSPTAAMSRYVDEDEGTPAVLEGKTPEEKYTDPEDPGTWEVPPITESTWESIKSLFKAHKIDGRGPGWFRVIDYVTGKKIKKGSELTEDEGQAVYRFLQEKVPAEIQKIAASEE